MGLTDPMASLLADMAQHGLCPASIRWDGKPHRFPGAGRRCGTDGWYIAHQHQRVAHYGDHAKTDTIEWRNGASASRTPEDIERDRRVAKRRAEEDRRHREQQEETLRAEWSTAEPASPDHKYLTAKKIGKVPLSRANVRQADGKLLIAVRWPKGTVVGLQRIKVPGEPKQKQFATGSDVKGSYASIMAPDSPPGTLYIVEGWVTGTLKAPARRRKSCAGSLGCAILSHSRHWTRAHVGLPAEYNSRIIPADG